MKIISTEVGRVTQSFVPDEIRPVNGLNMPEFVRLIQERYGFAKVPTISEIVDLGAKFTTGRLLGARTVNIAELIVFRDGIIVTTFNTDDAEFVMNDLISWSEKTFDARSAITIKPRIYLSNIVVEFEKSIDPALKIFDGFKQELQRSINDTYGTNLAVGNYRIDFSAPPKPLSEVGRPFFLIERRDDYPFEANRFYSSAALRTDAHVGLLRRLEEVLPLEGIILKSPTTIPKSN